MPPASPRERLTLVALPAHVRRDAFARAVAAGFAATPKHLPCCYFYDRDGSQLFEDICSVPEYYLTRAETEILRNQAANIAARFGEGTRLVELGSGAAVKTRILIEAFLTRRKNLTYVPMDICRSVLEDSSLELVRAYPSLTILAVAAEYQEGLRHLNTAAVGPKLVLWLGSNIGNFDRGAAAAFLRQVRESLGADDRLLVGIDLRKDRATLEAAYDDSLGVTAQFNKNILARINRELAGHFDLEQFRHRATYEEEQGRIAMYLVSTQTQRVAIDRLRLEVAFADGEAIHTEDSHKYSSGEIEALAGAAGLRIEDQWLDGEKRFSVNLFAPIKR